jgi:hypothetical protein
MMNPPRKEPRVERAGKFLLTHKDLVIALIFLMMGFLMGKF